MAGALTLLLLATDISPFDARDATTRRAEPLAQVGAYAATLSTSQTAGHAIALERGREYHVAARCSGGCAVTLQLFSPAGREVDRDLTRHASPEVAVVPAASGRYRADVTMTGCAIHLCTYTLAVFVR
jgi:hypothetical protein